MSDAPLPSVENPRRRPVGPLVATVVVVLILALGGLYFFVTQVENIHARQSAAAANS